MMAETPWHYVVPLAGQSTGEVGAAARRVAQAAEHLAELAQEAGGAVAEFEVRVVGWAKRPEGLDACGAPACTVSGVTHVSIPVDREEKT